MFVQTDMNSWWRKIKHIYKPISAEFAGKPFTYVEVGVWGAASAHYCCHEVLTHPDARGYGIDPYEIDFKRDAQVIEGVYQGARERLKKWIDNGQFQLIRGRSQDVLRTWPHGKIDFLYLDGAHHAHDVLLDFVLAWPHLKRGSVILFDDYGIGLRQFEKDGLPRVPVAVSAIEQCFGLFLEKIPVEGTKQYALRVVTDVPNGEAIVAGVQWHQMRLKQEFCKPGSPHFPVK
jgi:hypothetical protein